MRYSTRVLANPALPTPWLPHQSPQSACPLICGHEREGNGTTQDKRADHRADSAARERSSLRGLDFDVTITASDVA